MKSKYVETALHLIAGWVIHNVIFFFVFYMTCIRFGNNEYETVLAMMVFTLGLGVMYFDLWCTRQNKLLGVESSKT